MAEEHTLEGLRAEVDRLQRELDQASSEKIQSVCYAANILTVQTADFISVPFYFDCPFGSKELLNLYFLQFRIT